MSEEKPTESNESVTEKMEDAIEEVADVVEEAVEEAVEKVAPPLLKLKEENPKLFFGGIAGIVVVLGVFLMSGGDSSSKHTQNTSYAVGQSYTLQAQNAVGDASLKILKIPGQMASFDRDEDIVCKAPTGTPAVIRSFQDAFGKKNLFAQVEIQTEAGDCRQGVKGWTLSTNLK